jgi:hypothetical protein
VSKLQLNKPATGPKTVTTSKPKVMRRQLKYSRGLNNGVHTWRRSKAFISFLSREELGAGLDSSRGSNVFNSLDLV